MDGINFQSNEDPEEYAKLKTQLFNEYRPSEPSEEKLLASIAKALWKVRRAQRTKE